MAEYSFLFHDLVTNDHLAELPVDDARFGRTLKGAGPFTGNVPIGDARITGLGPEAATRPGRTLVYVTRDGTLFPEAYVLWTRRYQRGTLELSGTGLWSMLRHRLIRSTLTFAETDQATIASAIVAAVQAVPGGDLGIAVAAPATGVERDRTYYGYELKEAGEAIEQLSDVIDGFDFQLEITGTPAAPTKTLVVSYPRRGVQGFDTPLLYDLPGNILSYAWPDDASGMAVTSWGIGAGEGDDMLLASFTDGDAVAAGYPLLEQSRSYKDVRDQQTLDEHAEADALAASTPVTIPQLTVRGDVDPVVGSFDVGDDCRIRIEDDWFPDGIDVFARIVGFEVNPEQPDQQEQVVLDLGPEAS